ncbi:MAG TPA: aldehyde dehydrogenase family protein [Beijerinckiaceae bacterium]|nr:aldehyde dehydrogenase family protein [Beijerinckiaceae bacterium]
MEVGKLDNAVPPQHAGMLIDGEWRFDGPRIDVFNPARPDEVVGTIIRGTPADVDAAVGAAQRAQGPWSRLSHVERAALLEQALVKVGEDLHARARTFVRENGKSFDEAKGELQGVLSRQRLTLALAPQLDQERELAGPNGRTFLRRRPFGVVVSIVPWNSPVSLAFTQIISALLAGNAVVLKPPETCPLALCRTIELAASALPPGVINLVTGLPDEIGERLTTHPDVGKIGFTGSIASARSIAAKAAQTIKSLNLELGGNDPAVVLDDLDLSDEILQRMVDSTYRMTGQVCMAIKRIYVPASLHDRFVDAFSRVVDRIVVGDGLEPGVTMGPLHTERGRARARALVEDARKRGATVEELGCINDDGAFDRGWFMRPMVVTELPDEAPMMVEEQFCPALPITAYDDIDSALARANDSIYGLGASVWGGDVDEAAKVGRRLEAGTVWINTHGTQHINRTAPYGGIKQSGIGRKAGVEGVLEYTQIQTLTMFEHNA